jgi:hypothetical protein
MKTKTLHSTIFTVLTVGCVTIAGPAVGDGKVTYNPIDETVHIPTVHIGTDQYEVKMKHEETGDGLLKFAVTDLSLISQLTFKDSANPNFSRIFTLTEMLAQFPSITVEVLEFLENRPMTFRGITVNALFDTVYGDDWRNREEVLFTALDGFQSSIPVEQFLQYDSFVAYEYADANKRPSFVLIKDNDGKFIDLGPFWLVWDNLSKPSLQGSVSYGWPYQLASFELVTFAERYPNSVPPANTTENVQSGFLAARVYCMACHKVKGDGGNKAPDLIQADLVSTKTDERLKQLILDREALPDVSGMVLREEVANRDQVADEIIAYLRAIDASQ